MSLITIRKYIYPGILMLYVLLGGCKKEYRKKGHEYTNSLIEETSPYLLQHAHNPVNWRPWSEKAFEEAREENKLVIVSIGYSSCHWCHVMEEETFEDLDIANLMNQNFINIKVDREERPDIDQVYMTAVQLMTDNSGWPLNVITLPNGKPLYGGTYHSKTEWAKVLNDTFKIFKEDPEKAEQYASMVAEGIQQVNLISPPEKNQELKKEQLINTVERWKQDWDLEWGGDVQGQKFILPGNLEFLMEYSVLNEDQSALDHIRKTLDKVALGGIYDHLGGGFYRYSTDPYWRVPHFEKMLYDNAQMIGLYAKAFTVFNAPEYKKIVYETLHFLRKQMKNPKGGYYAAIDAGRKGEEGIYYLWEKTELQQAIGEDLSLFSKYYNTIPGKEYEGRYLLHKLDKDEQFAQDYQISLGEFQKKKARWKSSLMALRNQRALPGLDDKIITSWNALLISGLIQAYNSFGDNLFLKEAEELFSALTKTNIKRKELVHSYKEGSKQTEGFLEDYAYLIDAALQLYSATMDTKYLDWVQQLTIIAGQKFKDKSSALYMNNDNDLLIAKTMKTNDGDLPSPNSVMARNLFRLGHLEYNTSYMEESRAMLATMFPLFKVNPENYAGWGALFLNEIYPYYEIAVVGDNAPILIKELQQQHLPNTLIAGSSEESELPLFQSRFVTGETYIYVCRDNSCKLPVTSIEEALDQLHNF